MIQPLVPLVGEVGVVDGVVEGEGVGMVGTTLPKIEHGRIRTKLAEAITIGNGVMTRRWPVLGDRPSELQLFSMLFRQKCVSVHYQILKKGVAESLSCSCAVVVNGMCPLASISASTWYRIPSCDKGTSIYTPRSNLLSSPGQTVASIGCSTSGPI